MTEKLKSIISYIILMIITIIAGSYAIGFLVQKSAICDKNHIQFCTTESVCVSNDLYWWDNSCHFNDKIVEIQPSEYPDYDSLSILNNLILVSGVESYTPKGKILDKNIIYGIFLKSGKISKGYLEIIASINNKPLTTWESIYFKAPYNVVNHYLYGGHIFRPDSLKVPSSDKTHLLFALNNIPFLSTIPYLESVKPNTFDLFKVINENKEVKFLTYISSLTPAKIDLIKLYYECDKDFNNGNCELTLSKK